MKKEEKAKPPCFLSFFLVAEIARNFMLVKYRRRAYMRERLHR
jgi:hypothetical protein